MTSQVHTELDAHRTRLLETAERFTREGVARGIWDASRERISLGGLLTLRCELEQICTLGGVGRIEIVFCGVAPAKREATSRLAREVLRSRIECRLQFQEGSGQGWPTSDILGSRAFSYQFFDRIALMARVTHQNPHLAWSAAALGEAASVRARFGGRLVALHMKRVPGQGPQDSNADPNSWRRFLQWTVSSGELQFLLLGDDEVPDEILSLPRIHHARHLSISLSTQLALVGLCDGFLGMASGICAAAVLGPRPYVLLKHPQHHVAEMERELGMSDQFEFAGPCQRVWRRLDTEATLAGALEMMRGHWSEPAPL